MKIENPNLSTRRTAPSAGIGYFIRNTDPRQVQGRPLYATLGAFLRGLVVALDLIIDLFAVKLFASVVTSRPDKMESE
jgi:hypothetical protein